MLATTSKAIVGRSHGRVCDTGRGLSRVCHVTALIMIRFRTLSFLQTNIVLHPSNPKNEPNHGGEQGRNPTRWRMEYIFVENLGLIPSCGSFPFSDPFCDQCGLQWSQIKSLPRGDRQTYREAQRNCWPRLCKGLYPAKERTW